MMASQNATPQDVELARALWTKHGELLLRGRQEPTVTWTD